MGPAEDLPAPRLRFGVARWGRHLLVHGGTFSHPPLDRWLVLIFFVPVFMPGFNEKMMRAVNCNNTLTDPGAWHPLNSV
jgi:hypothetical protein